MIGLAVVGFAVVGSSMEAPVVSRKFMGAKFSALPRMRQDDITSGISSDAMASLDLVEAGEEFPSAQDR
jgi:hypothetical protein